MTGSLNELSFITKDVCHLLSHTLDVFQTEENENACPPLLRFCNVRLSDNRYHQQLSWLYFTSSIFS